MKMQRSALIRSLLVQNIALSRETQHLYAYLKGLQDILARVDVDMQTGMLPLDRIRSMRASLRLVCDAVEKRQIHDTGRTDHPTAEELGKIAKTDQGIDSVHFTVLDPKSLNQILDTIFKDINTLMEKRDENKPKPDMDFGKFYFFTKGDPTKNLGGDLEGEWEDYRDDDPDFPQNPFAGAD
jgi:hypothetical protein